MKSIKSINVILHKKFADNNYGVLKIQILEHGKKQVQTLGIKILEDHWIEDRKGNKMLSKKCPDYNNIIAKIEEAKKQLAINDNQLQQTYSKNKTLLDWFQIVINRTSNHGSRIKLETLRNKFKAYLVSIKKLDISFADFNTEFIYGLRNFMLVSMDNNTVNHYLQMIKTLITKADKHDYYHYPKNPFTPIEFKNKKKKKVIPSIKEFSSMAIPSMPETHRLFKYRQAFIFKVFCSGMRSIDLQLLRWNMINVSSWKLDYKMYKTGTDISVYLNDNLLGILAYIIKYRYPKYQSEDIAESIKVIQKHHKNDFIFHFLSGEDFSNIKGNDFDKMTEKQYKTCKNKTIVYDRNLKQIAKHYGITTRITTHTARHLCASLLARQKEDVYTIQKTLGHQSVAITQKYLQSFDNDSVDNANKSLSEQYKF